MTKERREELRAAAKHRSADFQIRHGAEEWWLTADELRALLDSDERLEAAALGYLEPDIHAVYGNILAMLNATPTAQEGED